jgi:hypothetical protein
LEKPAQLDSIQPRYLRYRSHFKIYLIILLTLSGLILSFWGHRLSQDRWSTVYNEFNYEFWISACYFMVFGSFYFFWLKSRLNRQVQVFPNHICVHNHGKKEVILFEDVESVGIVCWSVFYFKMKDGVKHYFSSSLERVDYIWEGFNVSRPGVIAQEEYEAFRTKLVQYDHHQKRKDWFFRHKLIDVFNWILLPLSFLFVTYFVQTREIVINQQGMYFFRLCMYSILVMMATTFLFSVVLKKFVFDKRVKLQMGSQPDDKLRDIEFEGIVLHRSKMMQMVMASFLFALVMRSEMNLFSLTKIKEDLSSFNLKSGKTLVVDNRYNCLTCKYPVKDGDVVVFGKGTVGQIMATEGDMVGQIAQDKRGRIIASENIQEVPRGHIAIKLANQREIVMIKLGELIGKIQK